MIYITKNNSSNIIIFWYNAIILIYEKEIKL